MQTPDDAKARAAATYNAAADSYFVCRRHEGLKHLCLRLFHFLPSLRSKKSLIPHKCDGVGWATSTS